MITLKSAGVVAGILILGVLSTTAQTLYVPGGSVGSSGNGNVGLGMSNPLVNFDLIGTSATTAEIRVTSQAGYSALLNANRGSADSTSSSEIVLSTLGIPEWMFGTNQWPGACVSEFGIYSYGTDSNVFTIQKITGNIGIGTDNPTDLGFGAHTVQSVGPNPYFIANASAGNPGYVWFSGGTEKWCIDDLTNASDRLRIYNPTSGEVVSILQGANVGIGTTDPTYPLTVNGTIRAKEVIVDTGWSDYIFSSHYPWNRFPRLPPTSRRTITCPAFRRQFR